MVLDLNLFMKTKNTYIIKIIVTEWEKLIKITTDLELLDWNSLNIHIDGGKADRQTLVLQ